MNYIIVDFGWNAQYAVTENEAALIMKAMKEAVNVDSTYFDNKDHWYIRKETKLPTFRLINTEFYSEEQVQQLREQTNGA